MTHEEVRDRLDIIITKHEIDDENVTITNEKDYDAIRVAIKALEQQACGDCISRQAVLDIFADNADATRPYGTAWEEVKALPSVNPQPICEERDMQDELISRRAVQIELKNCKVVDMYDENDNFVGYYNADTVDSIIRNLPSVNPQRTGHWIFDEILDKHYYCSECKSMGVDYWDYCPNCGAKMVEPQESEV